MALWRPHRMKMVVRRGFSAARYGGLAPLLPFWIPAFAGKTSLGGGV